VASPLLPERIQLWDNHISALLALAVDGQIHKAAIKLLAPTYSHQEAEAVWAVWAPHLSPSPNHPLAVGKLLRDAIVHILHTPCPKVKFAREDASKLVDDTANSRRSSPRHS